MKRVAIAAAGFLLAIAVGLTAVALADDVQCSNNKKTCKGTQFDDQITGTSKGNGINAKDGNDSAYGLGGNDVIEMGDGFDYVEGGKGNDKISGGDGDDTAIIGGLFGGRGDDMVTGGDGNDDLYGDDGKDVLVGGGGDDQLVGSGATPGNDGDKDRLTCGPGFDTAIISRKDKADQSCEDIILER